MEILNGVKLVNASRRETVANNYLNGKKYVAFYFSAHWCPPCRQFTPLLAQAYANALSRKGEVIFVSSDRSEEEMYTYMREAHGGWLAIDYKNSALRSLLGSRLEVHGIPALVVVNLFDGSVMSQDARSEVSSFGSGAFSTWDSLCSEVDTSISELLKDNDDNVMRTACDILNRLLSNVIKDPRNMKYRSIKLDNPKISSSLLNANGAFEVLFTVGFEESDGSLILPLNASISLLTAFRDKIKAIIDTEKTKENPPIAPTALMIPPSTSTASSSQSVKDSKSSFYDKIMREVELCRTYEDSVNQAMALSCVPVESLEQKAKKISQSLDSVNDKLLKDLTLVELLHWFKGDFFKWFDAPKCNATCGGREAEPFGSVPPTEEESRDGANMVEMYKCTQCQSFNYRFPRYHANPSKLLETRQGRCGEWANCFGLIARSMGYEVRRILDWTDHVWVEIFSEHQDKWIHVDPCEDVIDKPLLYECGWNKKLSYVIATSIYEVMDVTPRYVKDMTETKNRRNLVPEKWLSDVIANTTDNFLKDLPKEKKELLVQRRLKDLVELMREKKSDSDESLPGRQSGSSAWRLQRGEMGKLFKPHVWKPSENERKSKTFELLYDVVSDVYIHGDEHISGWMNGLSDMNDIFRKEEVDWNMVYLARQENSQSGKLSWEIDLNGSSLSIKSIELTVESKTYENGRVLWQLCGNNLCLIPSPSTTLNSEALAGAKKVSLSASLSGGKGQVAWQHAQIFRCSTKESEGIGLRLKITMQDDA